MTYVLIFFPEELITGAFLTKVCNKLGSVYFQLGLLLEVESACIQRLENDHRGNTWRILYEVLVEWRKNSKNRSNVIVMLHELIRALTHLELMDVVELVRHDEWWIDQGIDSSRADGRGRIS